MADDRKEQDAPRSTDKAADEDKEDVEGHRHFRGRPDDDSGKDQKPEPPQNSKW